jgi:hypothetical protein
MVIEHARFQAEDLGQRLTVGKMAGQIVPIAAAVRLRQ